MNDDIHPDRLLASRTDLAAALRLAARFDLHEGICNHFSLLLGDGTFLINAHGVHWSEASVSNVVRVDYEGRVLDPPGFAVEDTAFYIHRAIHRDCPHATCVLHTHMPYASALTLVHNARLEAIEQNAMRFHGRIAWEYDYGGLALEDNEGRRIAAALGRRDIVFLAGHGVIVTGATVASAFDDLYYLERACRLQVLARSTGLPLRPADDALARRTAAQFARCTDHGQLHFAALKRILDHQEPAYRQ